MSDERLLVLGAGTMGSQIAQQAALHGVEVDLVDISGEQLARAAEQNRRACALLHRDRKDAP